MATRRSILIGGGCALAGVGAAYAGVRQMGSMRWETSTDEGWRK